MKMLAMTRRKDDITAVFP